MQIRQGQFRIKNGSGLPVIEAASGIDQPQLFAAECGNFLQRSLFRIGDLDFDRNRVCDSLKNNTHRNFSFVCGRTLLPETKKISVS